MWNFRTLNNLNCRSIKIDQEVRGRKIPTYIPDVCTIWVRRYPSRGTSVGHTGTKDRMDHPPTLHLPLPPNPTQDVTLTWLCGLGGVGSLSYDSHLSAILLSSSVPVCTVPTSSVPASSVPASSVPSVHAVSASTVSGLHSADLLSLAGLFSVGLFGGSS